MKLTFDETIQFHRKMWNWIADKIEQTHQYVSKSQYFDEMNEECVNNFCYCCEYDNQFSHIINQHKHFMCPYCPIDWDNEYNSCMYENSLYFKFIDIDMEEYDERWKEAAELARQIANLPARKKEDYDL